jgi:signal transduction histidine kinase/ligand-binding sensor domain-containing protein
MTGLTNHVRKTIQAGLLSILIAFYAQGQKLPDEVQFERITMPGTIRSSQATFIIQDKLGLLWIAGHGLYRYDGFKFRQYKEISDRKQIFNSHDILCLLYDSVGNRILIGTRRFGILAYSYQSDQITSLSRKNNQPIVNQLAQTADGKIWGASYNSGLFYLQNDSLITFNDPVRRYVHPTTLLSKGDRLYVGEIGKVVVLQHQKVVEEISMSWQGTKISPSNHVSALHFDNQGKLWMGTEKDGVLVYDLNEKKFRQYFSPQTAPFYSKVTDIKQDDQGLIWILTKSDGIALYSHKEQKILHLMKDPFSQNSISSDNCFSMLKDRQGVVWIGATGDFNKFDHEQQKFKHINHNPLDKLSLTDNMVRGLYEDKDGKVWVGTDGGYINILDFAKQTVDAVEVKLPNDSTNYVPLYFSEWNDETVLIGTSAGLLQYNRQTKRFSHLPELRKLTQNRVIRQIVIRDGTLYFVYKGSLFVYDLKRKKSQVFKRAGSDAALNITAIHLDEKNQLWVGTNKGVSLFDKQNNTFKFIPFDPLPIATDGSLLLTLSIQQVGDKLYVGTFNAGLWELDISDVTNIPSPKAYALDEGLPSTTVYATVEDKNKNLWLSTNSGVAKFDTRNKTFISFSINEGLQEEEFNRLAYLKTRTGKIIFGGINGINIFDPSDIAISTQTFTPEILSASFFNPIAKNPNVLRFHETGSELKVPSDQNFVNIQFFVPYYKEPKRYTLSYRLENFEDEWKEVSTENSVVYSNLPPGTYTFKLRTVGMNAQVKEKSLSFTIAPPIWQTWWFILLSIIVVGFLVMTIIRSYIRKAQYDRQRLEVLLKIRTAEIERSKEELEILNQKKDLIFSILSHDLRSPLTTLKGFLGYLITHANEMSTDELKRHAGNIKNSVTNSLDLIDNTLFWSLSQMGNIQYSPINFSLLMIFEKLHGLYQLTADKKRITFSISCPENIYIHGDENMVYVTLRNLVSNALKFTTEGKQVSISCKRWSDYVEIKVVDHGIGMSEEYLQKLQSMDQPMLKKGTSNEKGTGLGLLLCKKFVELNKGELLISSKENVGTTFTVILPLAVHQHADQVLEK